MSPIQCAQFERTLEEQSDGPLPAETAAHMQGCADCRLLWSDLEAIRTAGTEWGREEVAPPERLWTSLRAQMEFEGLIRGRAARPASFAAWFGPAPRWALAGASISLLLIAGMLASYQTTESNPNESRAAAVLPARLNVPAAAQRLVASDLGTTLDGDLKRVFESLPERNPLLASSLRENLGIVDNLIAVCEKSVREQPNDTMARDYLYWAYQQKAVLLATATDRSALEGQ
jgi:hypothetical protein